jgi:hypothetical protein
MASVVDVINKALDLLGHGAITSLGDGTKAANLATRDWPLVRDLVLRDHPWNFAVKRSTTAPLVEAPAWGFSYQHEFPSDLLRLLEIRDLRADEYQIEGNKILTDESVLYLRYIRQVTDPNEYDALFIDTVSLRLAYEMCESLTQSNTKRELLWRDYENSMTRAKLVDAQENPPTVFAEDSWLESRY